MSNFTIGRGDPQYSGRYVCYLPGITVATALRLWIVGHGWANLAGEPVAGPVMGWIGPLPTFPENCVDVQPKPVFDL